MFSSLAAATPRFRLARVPSLCAVCHGWGSTRVCAACIERFAPPAVRCLRCALRLPRGVPATAVCGACLIAPPPYERCIVAVDYGHPWDRLIQHFKFRAALDLAPSLAARLVDAVRHAGAGSAALIVPVPLSRERLRERGYNQAGVLARRIAAALRLPTDARLLLRVKDTPHQLSLEPNRRAANVRDVFAVEPTRRAELRGREVAVVDDVVTTGATGAEVARVLLQAGAARVDVWAVARTPRPGEA